MAEKLDLVIFGATGFTGKHTVKQLGIIAKEKPVKWGIAGRSENKLKSILEEFKDVIGDYSKVKIIIADINDEESLKKMAEQAKVIVNCCGPYRFYGEAVIKACLAARTHHVDVSGEPQYMEKMQLKYNDEAKDKGVYIVSACGFDSVPSDLGVVYLQQIFDGTVNSAEAYLRMKNSKPTGGAILHYGTWESAVYGLAFANELRPLRTKLYPERLPELKPKLEQRSFIHKSQYSGDKWAIPFLGSDKSVVMRSQRFFYEHDKKRPVQMRIYMVVNSLLNIFVMGVFGLIFSVMTKFSIGRKLLLKFPRVFSGGWASHEGPSEETMENTKFTVTIVGKGWSKDKSLAEPTDQHTEPPNKTAIVEVSGVNPGYGATCVILLQCAIAILNESDKMPDNGGVLPPGAAFANTSLIKELNKSGVTFTLSSAIEE